MITPVQIWLVVDIVAEPHSVVSAFSSEDEAIALADNLNATDEGAYEVEGPIDFFPSEVE